MGHADSNLVLMIVCDLCQSQMCHSQSTDATKERTRDFERKAVCAVDFHVNNWIDNTFTVNEYVQYPTPDKQFRVVDNVH